MACKFSHSKKKKKKKKKLIHFVSRESIWHLISLNLVGAYSFQFPTFNGRDVYTLCNNNKGLNVFTNMAEVDFS
ncbi:hypothetical protein Hanom_Chr01g00080901 [Helianthus anomalus]